MVRPILTRRIFFQPGVTYFKPAGIPLSSLAETILTVEEFESIRLKDYENMDQEKAAKKMNISQPTFSRLLESGRKKIATAIVKGQAIRIQGGNFEMVMPRGRGLGQGLGRGRGFGRGEGFGRGRMGGFAAGPVGNCICPKCGYKEAHQVGIPCYQKKCPKCGSPMIRRQ